MVSFKSDIKIGLKNTKKPNQRESLIIPTKDHIRRALKHANVKYQAIILLMSSSGMGSSDIRHLTIKDYLDSLEITKYDLSDEGGLIQLLRENESRIPTWTMRRLKTGMHYETFSSPESVQAINDYIAERIEKKTKFHQ